MASGMVQTVLGDVEPSALGITLAHEHLLIGFFRWRKEAGLPLPPSGVPDDPRAKQPITLENISWIRRYGSVHPDNPEYGLQDEALVVDEVKLFKNAGGGSLVELTNPDLTRDPEGIVRISRATGVHVVAGAGHYIDEQHPLDMDERSEDQIAEQIVGDVTKGCDGTSIKAGIIGEMGCSAPMTSNERKALRAAARAQRATGAALIIHPGRSVAAPLIAMDVVVEAGGDPERTIMSHVDRTLFDLASLVELARRGCYIQFDLFGHEISHYTLAPIDMPNDAMRINHFQGLIANGYGEKLLVARDIATKHKLVKYGGDGYAHILENVVPIMKRKGMTQDQIDSILVHNPARILTMVLASNA